MNLAASAARLHLLTARAARALLELRTEVADGVFGPSSDIDDHALAELDQALAFLDEFAAVLPPPPRPDPCPEGPVQLVGFDPRTEIKS